MNSERAKIFAHLHQSLRHSQSEQELLDHLKKRSTYQQPLLSQPLVPQFFAQLKKVSASVETLFTLNDLPFAIVDFLERYQLVKEIVVSEHFKNLIWPYRLQIHCRPIQKQDATSVTLAFAGIAETGSVVLLSGPKTPNSLNFLPENHIVVLFKNDLVTYMEDVWHRLRFRSMPRAVTVVTGPSRTADIEQTIQLGAHGPRRLHIILVEKGEIEWS